MMASVTGPRAGGRLLAVVALILVGVACGESTDADRAPLATTRDDGTAEDETTGAEANGAEANGAEANGAEATEDETTREEPRHEPGAEPVLALPRAPAFTDPIEHHGSGDARVDVEVPGNEPALLHLSNDGAAYLHVTSVDPEGQRIQRIVRERGTYEGIRPLNFAGPPVGALDIAADGDWSLVIRPLGDAREAHGRIEGSGDEVFLLGDPDASEAHVTHEGRARFHVRSWGHVRLGMIGAVGDYEGRVELHPEVLAIEVVADGDWTFDLAPASSGRD